MLRESLLIVGIFQVLQLVIELNNDYWFSKTGLVWLAADLRI